MDSKIELPRRLQQLSLDNNSIICGCNLFKFVKSNRHNIKGLENIFCRGYDKALYLLNEEELCETNHLITIYGLLTLVFIGIPTGYF